MIPYNLKNLRALIFDVDGVLSRETITMDSNAEPLRTVNIKDGYAMQYAIKQGLDIAIITGGNTESVRLRYERLGLKNIYMSAAHKITVYEEYLRENNLTNEEVLYMGDDIPDYEVMARVGCPVCPNDAAQEIRDISLYISPRCGGEGCARDVIEQVMRAQNIWMNDRKAFGW